VILASPLAPLEHLLRGVLDWFHGTIGLPWAWAIVAVTVSVRILLVPLTVKQIHSMQNMQRHAPQMKEIQRKFKGDRARQNEELMKFYKENNINPASSCLPLVAQFPVFIALFYVLKNFSKHPPSGNLHWLGLVNITDHANHGWGYLLLGIYAASQIASTLLMGTTMDKTQRTILLVMPLAFLAVVSHFPAGLVLYWMTTNLWTVGQGLITRRLVPKKPPEPPKRSSRTPRADEGDSGNGAQPKSGKPKPGGATTPPRRVKKKKKARR